MTHDASLLAATGKYFFAPVVVGDSVFIGYGAVVMPGVTIGNNVIIGSNAVVTKDIPDGMVVVGVPGRILCSVDDLKRKRETVLVSPPFDWRGDITNKDIVDLQNYVIRVLDR
ncbi:DapH/DapD/GlmU-related protein [Vogesella indigofera]|uniref:DapH/DapD/GlmU-related protein n=1 Tax=Vogesella indigofera TaxID=45465 RepID=UPI003F43B5BA